jgi:putative addiction module component (TIGR02574 family)
MPAGFLGASGRTVTLGTASRSASSSSPSAGRKRPRALDERLHDLAPLQRRLDERRNEARDRGRTVRLRCGTRAWNGSLDIVGWASFSDPRSTRPARMHGRDEIVRSVLELPEHERAEVVREILDSLDRGTDQGAEEAWAQEVAQRIRDLTGGKAKTVPAGEAIDRARSRLGRVWEDSALPGGVEVRPYLSRPVAACSATSKVTR